MTVHAALGSSSLKVRHPLYPPHAAGTGAYARPQLQHLHPS
jgi:hypothetical protein